MPMRHTWAWAAGLRPTVRLTVGNLLRTPCAGSAVSPPRTAPAVSLCAWPAPSTRPLAQVCPSDTTLGVSAATAGALQPLQRARENRIRNGVIGAGQGEGVRGVGTVHRGKIIGNVVEAWEQRTVRELERARDPAHFDDFKVGDSVAVQFVNVWNRQKLAIFAGICIARRGGQLSASFTLRNHIDGFAVEQVFALNSPLLRSIRRIKEPVKRKKRGKLYYLRDRAPKESTVVVNERELNLPTTP